MSLRALALGTVLGAFIAAFTYFNDHVIRQTPLINNHLPASVFGLGVVLLITVNPLLALLRRAPLRAGEVALAMAMSLAVCGWPGASFFGYFYNLLAMPAHQMQVRPEWRASDVFAYVPGGEPQLSRGYVRDWPAFVARLRDAEPATDPAAYAFARRAGETMRAPLERLLRDAGDRDAQRELLQALDAVLSDPTLPAEPAFDAVSLKGPAARARAEHRGTQLAEADLRSVNRQLFESTFVNAVTPRIDGSGVLLLDGAWDPEVVHPLVSGTGKGPGTGPRDVPWEAWWPPLRLWGGVAVLTALAVLCLMVIVHPQWSNHELLPYPTVQIVSEVTRREEGRVLPELFRNKAFWWGFGSIAAIHLLNGSNAWFPGLPFISLKLDFSALGTLFPNARVERGFLHLVSPTIYPCAVGLAFLVSARVSASVGLSLVAWVVFAAVMTGASMRLTNDRYAPESAGPLLRFGAYVGMTMMIAYFGRRYYWGVVRGIVGLPNETASRTTVWAARGVIVCSMLAVWLLHRDAGMSPLYGGAIVAMVLMASLVLARINVETGLFYAQPDWYPVMLITGAFGIAGVGPETMVVTMMASYLLMPEPREGIAPFLINGLGMSDKVAGLPPRRSVWPIAAMLVVGFVVAMAVTLTLQYRYGFDLRDHVAARQPGKMFSQVAAAILELDASRELADVVARGPLERLAAGNIEGAAIGWALLGVGLVLACAVAHLRLPWWPIHPVLFLVWGTWPSFVFGGSFLLAAVLKYAVVKIGGRQAYHTVKPLMIGLIIADLLMVLFWSGVGASYFAATGRGPSVHRTMP